METAPPLPIAAAPKPVPGTPPAEAIYQSENLRIFARHGFPGALTVITFSSYSDEPGLDRQGFGEAFLFSHQINAVHVVCASNRWFQYDDMPQALAAIRAALPAGAEIVTYGLSMGGYAAINFNEALGACRVVAISPQYSVDPAKMPRETRWRRDIRALRFPHDRIGQLRGTAAQVFIVYDDRNPDRQHIQRIRRTTKVREVVIPFAGHPVTALLVETGLLSGLALALLRGTHDPHQFATRLRQAQQHSAMHLIGLHAALPTHRARLRRDLLIRAEAALRHRIAHVPADADPWFHLSRVQEALDRPEDAMHALRHFLSRADYLWGRLHLARLLLTHAAPEHRTRDAAEADALLAGVLQQSPDHWDARLLHGAALERLGRYPEAETLLQAMRDERPTSIAVRKLLRHIRQPRPGLAPPLHDPAWPRLRRAATELLRDAIGHYRHAANAARAIIGFSGPPD